jgi:hypothetical protein
MEPDAAGKPFFRDHTPKLDIAKLLCYNTTKSVAYKMFFKQSKELKIY